MIYLRSNTLLVTRGMDSDKRRGPLMGQNQQICCDDIASTMPEPTSPGKFGKRHINRFRTEILSWYDENQRSLPWRVSDGRQVDPYQVWLSEIMLQQTVVNTVIPYFQKFIKKWPTVHDLAVADRDEVMSAWAGLGYYSRARNLHKCAQMISGEFDGRFPRDQSKLKDLPGIGDYTSAAIAAIAYDEPATVIDGNVERVVARYFAVQKPLPAGKKGIRAFAEVLSEGRSDRPGDFAQSMMDLGATVCIPGKPRCGICPLQTGCAAAKLGIADLLPLREKKKKIPTRTGYAYWIEDGKGNVLFQRRPPDGLLGGMTGLPTSEWLDKREGKPGHPSWIEVISHMDKTTIFHVFTHFKLELKAVRAGVNGVETMPDNSYWVPVEKIEKLGLPTVFKKLVRVMLQY